MNRADGKIDSYTVDMEYIEDTFEKPIAQYDFPYRDGAKLEDMGAKPRTARFRCYFWGDAYTDHFGFLEHVRRTGDFLFELIHPAYGPVKGKIPSVTVRHDDGEAAEIDITFMEEFQADFTPQGSPDVSSECEAAFTAGQAQQMLAVAANLVNALGNNAAGVINTVFDPAESLISQVNTVSFATRDLINKIDTAISRANALAAGTTIPATALVSAVDYGTKFPGYVVGTFARAAARCAASLYEMTTSPKQFIDNLKSTFDGFASEFSNTSFPCRTHMQLAAAQVLALETGYRYSEDEDRRSVVRSLENVASFSTTGEYSKPVQIPVIMTLNDLESTLYEVREYLQNCISIPLGGGHYTDVDRSVAAIKQLAVALLRHVNVIKIEREKIVEREYNGELPLHVICMREGLSYTYADRILSINPQIINPSFVSGVVKVYAA